MRIISAVKAWAFPTFLVFLSLLLQVLNNAEQELFSYDREAIFKGEYWRIVTGHFTHLGWRHLILNLIGLIAIWQIYNKIFSLWLWSVLFLFCAIGVSILFFILSSDIENYVGLSGVLHGVIAAVALYLLLENLSDSFKVINYEAVILFLGLVFKLIYEKIWGGVPLTEAISTGHVLVEAHIFGAVLGGVFSLFISKFRC